MKKVIEEIEDELYSYGEKLCRKKLEPAIKKWLKKHDFDKMHFINGQTYVEKGEIAIWPDRMDNIKVANELIDIGNALGYKVGFSLGGNPVTIEK